MSITIQTAVESDIPKIINLIKTTFDVSVAPQYSQEGCKEFYKYIDGKALAERLNTNHLLLKAMLEDKLVGIIEIRDNQHVAMLFVHPDNQRQGIGHNLISSAITTIKQNNPTLTKITVHSSPNSVSAYEHFGFKVRNSEKEIHGILFTTMELSL